MVNELLWVLTDGPFAEYVFETDPWVQTYMDPYWKPNIKSRWTYLVTAAFKVFTSPSKEEAEKQSNQIFIIQSLDDPIIWF